MNNPNTLPEQTTSVFAAMLKMNSESRKLLFCEKYGAGLGFLVEHTCGSKARVCFVAVVEASLEAILRGDVSRDEEIPALVRTIFRRVVLAFSESLQPTTTRPIEWEPNSDWKGMTELQLKLKIFTPTQREALYRFYVKREASSTICSDLNLKSDQFDFIRKAARRAVGIYMDSSATRGRKPLDRVSLRARIAPAVAW